MRTAAYKVDVASDRRRRENVPRHILCSKDTAHMHGKVALCIIYPKCYRQILMSFISLEWYCKNVRKHTK